MGHDGDSLVPIVIYWRQHVYIHYPDRPTAPRSCLDYNVSLQISVQLQEIDSLSTITIIIWHM